MRRWIAPAWLLACWSWGLAAGTASKPSTALGQRYFNLKEGYSLCPPASAARIRVRALSRTVAWSARDTTTGAITWTLSATRLSSDLDENQIEARAQQIRKDMEMGKKENHKVESCQVITVGGRKAIDLHLVLETPGEGRAWSRQVHLLTAPKEFLILGITGPAAERDRLLALHQAVLDSVELLDLKAMAAQREVNLAAGRQLLASLTAEKLTAAIEPQDVWYLFTHDGQTVGFMVLRERAMAVEGRNGVEVKAWSKFAFADGSGHQVATVMLASADRTRETYTWVVQAGGESKRSEALTMTKKDNKLTFAGSSTDLSAHSTEKVLDESMDRCYLPVAMSGMLGRLVDLGKTGSYAFAFYAGNAHELDVYTFTVLADEKVEFGGQTIPAVRAAVRTAEDHGQLFLLLDSSGRLLQSKDPTSPNMERSTRAEVTQRFPPAREMLNQIDADGSGPTTATSETK